MVILYIFLENGGYNKLSNQANHNFSDLPGLYVENKTYIFKDQLNKILSHNQFLISY